MLTASSVAIWASNASDRRSTSGAFLMHVSHDLKSWSTTQSLCAPSSSESNLCALLKASAEEMSFQSVVRDLGQLWSTVVYTDASAALDTRTRGLQLLIRAELERAEGCATRESVGKRQTCGYICTKGFNVEVITKHVSVADDRCSAWKIYVLPRNHKLQRERCGSGLAIDCMVRGWCETYSSNMSWIQH